MRFSLAPVLALALAAAACTPGTDGPTTPVTDPPAKETPGTPTTQPSTGSITSSQPVPAAAPGFMKTDITVRLLGAGSAPAGGHVVAFEVTQGRGVVAPARVTTGADGYATATLVYPLDDQQVVVATAEPNVRITTTVLSVLRQ